MKRQIHKKRERKKDVDTLGDTERDRDRDREDIQKREFKKEEQENRD